jgi:hypothetical protein
LLLWSAPAIRIFGGGAWRVPRAAPHFRITVTGVSAIAVHDLVRLTVPVEVDHGDVDLAISVRELEQVGLTVAMAIRGPDIDLPSPFVSAAMRSTRHRRLHVVGHLPSFSVGPGRRPRGGALPASGGEAGGHSEWRSPPPPATVRNDGHRHIAGETRSAGW